MFLSYFGLLILLCFYKGYIFKLYFFLTTKFTKTESMLKKNTNWLDRSKQRAPYIGGTPKSKLLHLMHQDIHKDTTQLISITKLNKN